MDMDDGQRYNIGSFSLDSTAKGRHAANELITKTEKIIIKDGITTINSAAFASFQSLTKITIPNSVKKIGDFALKDCKRLQQITIPASVVKIGGGAFENCTNLYDIKFESGSNCNSMENYPNNPGSSPIQNCKNLRTFQMPNRIKYISKYFFEGCDSLESVSFGKNFRGYQMTFGDENIFDDSSSLLSKKLQKIKVAKSNPYLESIDGILYDKQQKRLLLYPRGRISTTYRVPKGTKSMSDSAFRLCDRLQTVIISGKKLKLHYKRLFEDCKHVTLYVKSNSQVLNYAKKCNINYKIIN